MARRKRTPPRPPLRQRQDPRVHHRTLERTQSHALPNPLPTRTHGAVNTENTHPFRYTLGNDEHGYIAHNGIAQKHTNGRYASDSRNAILAWQTGQTDLTDGTQGKFAKIDQNGRIQWLTPPQTIEGAEGEPIQVSNTRWQDTIWDEWRTEYDDAYIEGWNDGYEAAINDMLNDGIDTTTGIRRR